MIHNEYFKRNAFVVSNSGDCDTLARIPFMSSSYNEAWIQAIIADSPSIIPSSDIGVQYSPLVCIGREVPVGRADSKGYIDNLYVSPSGAIVIVETKLFRNCESRRTVVAQIIDYAKELQKWNVEELDKVCSSYTNSDMRQSYRMIDLMAKYGYLSLADEAQFTDNVSHCLSTASFLLMIVGDGIRSGVQQLADFLNENSNMSFNLALVELELYAIGDDTIIIPNLLNKTTIIERKIDNMDFFSPEFSSGLKSCARKPILSRREFVDIFSDYGGLNPDTVMDFVCDLEAINGISVGIAPTELTIRLNSSEGKSFAILTFSISDETSSIWVMPGRLKKFLDSQGIFSFEADTFLESIKPFIDVHRCKYTPYENESSFYFMDIDKTLASSHAVFAATELFSVTVANYKQFC